jgi:hypothetical protein
MADDDDLSVMLFNYFLIEVGAIPLSIIPNRVLYNARVFYYIRNSELLFGRVLARNSFVDRFPLMKFFITGVKCLSNNRFAVNTSAELNTPADVVNQVYQYFVQTFPHIIYVYNGIYDVIGMPYSMDFMLRYLVLAQ